MINTPLTVMAESELALSDHVPLTGYTELQNGGVIKPDIWLPPYDDKERSRRMQWHLSSMDERNAETGDAHNQAPSPDSADTEVSREQPSAEHKWQSLLPLLGEEAEKKGHKLPNAFGVMPGFYSGRRHIRVSNAQVAIGRLTIPADGLTDIKVKSRELNWSLRLDAWLFPFLNMYGLCGYTRQDTDAAIGLSPLNRIRKRLGANPKDFNVYVDLTGVTYGAGFTLVGGYKNFFATYDSNYTISALRGDLPFGNTLSPHVRALINSIRLGWRKQLAHYHLDLWVGETHWDTTNTIRGTPQVPVLGTVGFRLREKTIKPWSTHIGTNIEITKSFQFVVDMGTNFYGLFAIAPTVMYRF